MTKQATKGICIEIFVKGTKWIKDQNDTEEKGLTTFVEADHDNSLSEPFPPRIAKIVTPGIKIGKTNRPVKL